MSSRRVFLTTVTSGLLIRDRNRNLLLDFCQAALWQSILLKVQHNTEWASKWRTPQWLNSVNKSTNHLTQICTEKAPGYYKKKSNRSCFIKDDDVILSPSVSPCFPLKPVKLKRTRRWSIFVQVSISYSPGPTGLIRLQNQVAVSLRVAFTAR